MCRSPITRTRRDVMITGYVGFSRTGGRSKINQKLVEVAFHLAVMRTDP